MPKISSKSHLIYVVKLIFIMTCLVACNLASAPPPATERPIPPTVIPEVTATDTPTAPAPTPDFTQRPLVWFNPLPHMQTFPERPFIGSEDFMDLFVEDAPWQEASRRIQVFELYGEWLGRDATNAQIRQLVSDLNRRGIAIAIAGGALAPTEACTGAIEGFAGIQEGVRIAQRIKEAGGTVHFVAIDHAYDAGTSALTPEECQLTPEEVAGQVYAYLEAIRKIFPDIIAGDDVTAQLDVNEIARWVEAYRSVTGEDLGFLHLDVDFGIPNWAGKAVEIERYLRSQAIDFGIFYLGNAEDPSDETWLNSAGERMKLYELVEGGQPDHIVFASWNDHPDYVLPESKPNTFTNFIYRYFEDKSALGVQTTGQGANLAYGKEVTGSHALPDRPPGQAFDGIFSTWWGAGDFAPQWIEVDLGAAYTIARIRLSISQDPDGETVHRVLGRGRDEEYRLLHEFDGYTTGDQVLDYTPPDAWPGIQFVRIETATSPSWVSWREIEIMAGE